MPKEQIEYKHRPTGGFAPGTRPGPGRTPIAKGGKPNAATLVRQAIENEALEIIMAMAARAKEGDTSAAKILLDRISPSLRSIEHIGADGSQLPVLQVRSKGDVIDAELTDNGASSQVNDSKPENPENKPE
jgi:hypothetical protein